MSMEMDRLSILLVEDNAYMRSLMRQILGAFGIKNILECTDGGDALTMLRDFPADLVIADWVMEPVDGLELTRRLRTAQDSPNPHIPIVLLTGHTERHRVEEARDAGVTEFLAKPVYPKAVYLRLQEVIERPRRFVKAEEYTGPDRRRKSVELPENEDGRREEDTCLEIETTPDDSTSS